MNSQFKNNIWATLKKPFFILAPMKDVTDTVFRRIILQCGRPDLFFTEFTNVEGLASEKGDAVTRQRLLFTPQEKPIIAQVWGKSPEHYALATKRIKDMGFDGIDINMGCPEKSVVKNGCCAALIDNPSLASEIIHATKEAAGEMPVSVKTRIGFDTVVTEKWVSFLLQHKLAAITVHGRTAKEESKVPAHWNEIKKTVDIRNQISLQTFIIGNGDVQSLKEAHQRVKESGVDGVMIGRGIFHNPFLFSGKQRDQISKEEMFTVMTKHLELFKEVWRGKKHYPTMKKYFKIYIQNFDGAAEVRQQFMETQTPDEALQHITLSTVHTTYTILQHED